MLDMFLWRYSNESPKHIWHELQKTLKIRTSATRGQGIKYIYLN